MGLCQKVPLWLSVKGFLGNLIHVSESSNGQSPSFPVKHYQLPDIIRIRSSVLETKGSKKNLKSYIREITHTYEIYARK